MRRAVLVATAAAAAVLGGCAPATAEPYLTAEDTESLVGVLAEARAVQGVCYGWQVDVVDDSGGPSGQDAGSDQGAGASPSQRGCGRWVELQGRVEWTPATSDQDDWAGFEVVSEGLADPPTTADLIELGIEPKALTRDDGDEALYRAVAALPRLVADRGEAPSVELEPAEASPPAGAGPTGWQVPDRLRQSWLLFVLGAGLVAAAAVTGVAFARGAGGGRADPGEPTGPGEPADPSGPGESPATDGPADRDGPAPRTDRSQPRADQAHTDQERTDQERTDQEPTDQARTDQSDEGAS